MVRAAFQLREYPVPFGNRLVDLYTDLTSSPKGCAPLPEPLPKAMESFIKMRIDDDGLGLQFAALDEVYTYLRLNKNLRIPSHWKTLVPKTPPVPTHFSVPCSTWSTVECQI